jgi:23S rRNA (pseudouridine1915-N3)-methyltransferase
LRQAIELARKRLVSRVNLSIIEVADSPDNWPVDRSLQAEADQINRHLQPRDYVILLDLDGQWPRLDSEGSLRPQLANWLERAQGELVFIIGGSNGIAPTIKQRSQSRICLSRLTFTHQMARLILLDLLDRAIS